VTRPFQPFPFTAGGHRQTLLGYLCRRRLVWHPPCEDIVLDAGGDVRLLLRASWQPGPRDARPALVVVHGLGGCDSATYVHATGLHAWGRGWHVIRANMRSAGDSVRLCADVLAVLRVVAERVGRLGVVGFSLGANLALLALARHAGEIPSALLGVVAVSPPLDLAECAARIERPANRMYQRYFMVSLREAYRIRQALRPDLYEAGRERDTRTIRQYDRAITAPYGGYRDLEDYYARSSAGPLLASIRQRALILAAQDDPLVPVDSVVRWPLPEGGHVRRELPGSGGHTGFVGRTSAPGRFWAAERALDFLDELSRPPTAAP
jgi:predicted alpha/beta-fold hydrolase